MTEQEIVKALRCCTDQSAFACHSCPCPQGEEECLGLCGNAADLIDSLQAEVQAAKDVARAAQDANSAAGNTITQLQAEKSELQEQLSEAIIRAEAAEDTNSWNASRADELEMKLVASQANAMIQEHIIAGKHNPMDTDTITKLILQKTDLERQLAESQRREQAAVEDMQLIAGDIGSPLTCAVCKYNPHDMGCELDGSQFDDDGECHFTWRGPEAGEGGQDGK
ncbi:MAG: hypothetical protein LBS36_13570 [Oscillospiraceae bacterium]|jgi:hypothetical protein|nr:hypothetical protein [Oscillospiraceae bacterium]